MDRQTREALVAEALRARQYAVAGFSGFRVGAALLARDGTITRGCNIENCTYGLTVCAERVALFTALASGSREFTAVAVVTQSPEPSSPCGACRQVLWEFCGDILVVLATVDGAARETTLSTLFPDPFEFTIES